jgi:hypothetical protein
VSSGPKFDVRQGSEESKKNKIKIKVKLDGPLK